MYYHKNSKGFSLIEMLIIISVSAFLMILFSSFASNAISSFMSLQAEGLAQSKVADASFRVSRVFRGIYFIDDASTDTISGYAFFSPQDQFTSKITYYLSPDEEQLLADVTPMTADYPIGSTIDTETKTVVILDDLYKINGTPTFKYFNSSFTELSAPVSDLQAIKNISVNLHTKYYDNGNSNEHASAEITVNLRNRKTNL